MKKIISLTLFIVLVVSALAMIPVSAGVAITLDPNRKVPAEMAYVYEDKTTTNYKPGYVLHYMDFSKVTVFGQTRYFVAKNDASPAAETFELTGDALRIANDKDNKCYVLLTGNDIPKNIQDYTVDISFKFNNTDASVGNYFGYVMSATLGADGNYANLIDQCIRWKTGGLDNCAISGTDDATLAAIFADMQAGKKVDLHYEALGRVCEKITVTCNGNTAAYLRTQKATAAEGSYMGFFVGKSDSVDIYTVRVTAGVPSQYSELTWPSEEGALVQSVTSDAISNEIIDDSETLEKDRKVPAEPTLAYEDKITTYYNPGYVLHHMDFTKVDDFSKVGYFVTNDAEPKKFMFTDEGYLNVQTNNADGIRIMFTGNGIPKNIQDYTVRITFRHAAASTSYFNLIQSAKLDTATGKTSDLVETTVRYTLRAKGEGFEPLIDQSTYVGEDAALTAFVTAMQAGKWVTMEYSAMERNTMSITLTCDGNTVTFIKDKNTEAAADSFMGMLIGRGSNVEIHTVSVIAGTVGSYETLTWPAEENALVQNVAAAACDVSSIDTKDTESDTQESDTTDDTADSDDDTVAPDTKTPDTKAPSDDEKKGCGASATAMSVMTVALVSIGAALIKRRRIND